MYYFLLFVTYVMMIIFGDIKPLSADDASYMEINLFPFLCRIFRSSLQMVSALTSYVMHLLAQCSEGGTSSVLQVYGDYPHDVSAHAS